MFLLWWESWPKNFDSWLMLLKVYKIGRCVLNLLCLSKKIQKEPYLSVLEWWFLDHHTFQLQSQSL